MLFFIRLAAFCLCWSLIGTPKALASVPLPIPKPKPLAAPATACDRLTNNSQHPDAVLAKDVGFLRINSALAISACKASMARYPQERRFNYLLARAYDRGGQHKQARRFFGLGARLGDPFAMLSLAYLDRTGQGGPVNLRASAVWVKRAAETGHPQALARLSRYYRLGTGLTYNGQEALRLAKAAAVQGWPFGISQLGFLHKRGIGTPKNRMAARNLASQLYDIEIKRAEQGDVKSMMRVGWLYNAGDGIGQDRMRAIGWFQKALAAGNPGAEHALGWMYQYGYGVAKNPTIACDHYQSSAARMNASSMNNLGLCFRNGSGRKRNYQRARHLFEQATFRGSAFAPRNLARLYEKGLGVKKNMKKAVSLYKLSAERGHPGGMVNYGWHLDRGTAAKKPSQSQACDWYERAAARDHRIAMNNLALCYEGRGRKKNLRKSILLLQKAAARGHALAMRNLAIRYDEGRGVEQDQTRANQLFRAAADAGNVNSLVRLGYNVFHGHGVAGNPNLGCDLFEQATKKNSAIGSNNLATCYADGKGRERNVARAIVLFEAAINRGSSLAMRNLADHYFSGRVMKKNLKKANALFEQAAEAGDAISTYRYGFNLFWGHGIKRNRRAACGWFEKAFLISAVRVSSAVYVGLCWEKGLGRKRSRRKAFQAYEASAKGGNIVGMQSLARVYDAAIGVKRSGQKAAYWLRKSLAAGNERLALQLISAPHVWHISTRKALQRRVRAEGRYQGKLNGRFTAAMDDVIWNQAIGKKNAASGGDRTRLVQEFARVPVKGAPDGIMVRICKRKSARSQRLVVINHGLTTRRAHRARMRPQACDGVAEFFAQKGYVVAFPLRRGYGETAGYFAEDARGRCNSRNYIKAGHEMARDIAAVVTKLTQRDDIQSRDALVMGHSGGGWGTVALASKDLASVSGYINFSGGHGTRQGVPGTFCPASLTKAMRTFGRTSRKPILWLYVENDSYIGPAIARRMYRAYRRGASKAELVMMPRFEKEGHNLFQYDALPLWGPVINKWMAGSIK